MRHGRASRVTVLLDCNAGQLSLSVQDNGVGFASEQSVPLAPGHFGILGMRERAQKLGGTLRCSSEPGKGTVVHAVVPLPR
jgi:signal transduction histidine kinase